jgi:hypothetical protein
MNFMNSLDKNFGNKKREARMREFRLITRSLERVTAYIPAAGFPAWQIV